MQLQDLAHFLAVAETCARFLFAPQKEMRCAVSPSFCFVFILEWVLFQTENLPTIVIMDPDKRYYALFCYASYGFFEETRPLLAMWILVLLFNPKLNCCMYANSFYLLFKDYKREQQQPYLQFKAPVFCVYYQCCFANMRGRSFALVGVSFFLFENWKERKRTFINRM